MKKYLAIAAALILMSSLISLAVGRALGQRAANRWWLDEEPRRVEKAFNAGWQSHEQSKQEQEQQNKPVCVNPPKPVKKMVPKWECEKPFVVIGEGDQARCDYGTDGNVLYFRNLNPSCTTTSGAVVAGVMTYNMTMDCSPKELCCRSW